MYCIVFSCVVYSRFNAFRKIRESKTHGKISHSTVLNWMANCIRLTRLYGIYFSPVDLDLFGQLTFSYAPSLLIELAGILYQSVWDLFFACWFSFFGQWTFAYAPWLLFALGGVLHQNYMSVWDLFFACWSWLLHDAAIMVNVWVASAAGWDAG